jgi:peptide/nickel transport system ATP-binding protein
VSDTTSNGATAGVNDEAGAGGAGRRDGTKPLLNVEDLYVSFTKGKATVQAVAGVSFGIHEGETLGLVGESGCGKTTTGRAIVQVEKPTSGTITFDDVELTALDRSDLRTLRTKVQMIFQDPISSLNPRRRITDIVAEPLTIWKIGTKQERRDTANAMLDSVGIDPVASGERRPREFSGGQCQRISIARALVLEPQLLVCDEIVSALDVSVQAQILNLLEDLKREHNLTILFIAHDLAVVKNVSDRVAVMYLGRLCEIAPSDVLYEAPAHHYTSALLSAAVEPDPEAVRTQVVLAGEPPSPINPPSGCRFRTRCPRAEQRCADEVPELRQIAPDHQVACHFPLVGG